MNTSRKPLAIFTPMLGRWGHQFVKGHIEQILPGRTVVVAMSALPSEPPGWSVDAPVLCASRDPLTLSRTSTTERPVFDLIPKQSQRAFHQMERTGRVEAFFAEHGVKALLAQWMDRRLPLVSLARSLRLPYYCQVHGTDLTHALRDAEVRRAYAGYNEITGVVSPSEFGRRQLIDLGIEPGKALVVRHPVRIPPNPPCRDEGPIRCLAVGRLEPMRNTRLTIEAVRRAAASVPDLSLDIVGDGSLRSGLEQAIQDSGLDGRVRLHGYVPQEEVYRMMSEAHIFIHPSVAVDDRFDTCPVAVAEAAAHGMAIVATRHGGIPEEVKHEESGLLAEEHDVDAVADAILTLARDAGLRQRIASAARRRSEQMFAPEPVRARWHELLGLTS